ncbi:IstB domain protein ATP-binding protein [Chlorobium limicola DSM 245]|uniref:IstB domain protein ATP-binding protein n=1 Tax=Chlorobium limicola (strain DSM 245 / NBRC 103803 / 6330) TaxID=290315 RepID=B3EDH3_CHLL2|nr:IS21-like element helper ATPase IstB [Chlorobium limicola]ACD90598.1 IstB domain protein ATP-binding protein [Chlorobium limicola DSM 245]ACD90640.1 IstB domain protein ATP-binding protein [Chlorobium limicola DSM 245]
MNKQTNPTPMNTQLTIDRLEELRLHGMCKAYQAVLSMPVQHQPTISQFMARLAEAELQERSQARAELYLRQSKLRYDALLEQVHCSEQRNLQQEKLMTLADCTFIDRGENLLITGATGCGKSYLACALGRQACSLGYRTMYFGMHRFLERITMAKLDGSYVKLLNQIEKAPLVILDDFGLHPLDGVNRLALLQILEDRYGRRSTMITSQLPVSKWYEYIGDSTIADAIMDRLSVSAHRFELKGESLRKKK